MESSTYHERTHKHRGRFTERRAFQMLTEAERKGRRASARASRAEKTALLAAAFLWSAPEDVRPGGSADSV